jgi:hypothetical protein
MSTSNLPEDKGWPVRKADNLTAIYDCLENVGASTSHNPMGLRGLLQSYLSIEFEQDRKSMTVEPLPVEV